MAARMLFSDSHNEPVACVCNYSDKPHVLKADSFLGLAELVEHVPGTGRELVDLDLASSGNVGVPVQPGTSPTPESPELRLTSEQNSMAGLCTSTISATQTAEVAETGPSPATEGLYSHFQCLIDGLSNNLMAEQRARAETFIKPGGTSFRSPSTTLAVKTLYHTALVQVTICLILSRCGITLRLSYRSLTKMLSTCSSTTLSSRLHQHGVRMW